MITRFSYHVPLIEDNFSQMFARSNTNKRVLYESNILKIKKKMILFRKLQMDKKE